MSHRKTVKHYEEVRALHELTFSCYHRMPLLTNDVWRRMLAESITAATERHSFDLVAFVFMLEHVHLLVLPTNNQSRISSLLKAIKRPYSYRIKQLLMMNNSRLLERLTVHQRPGGSRSHVCLHRNAPLAQPFCRSSWQARKRINQGE